MNRNILSIKGLSKHYGSKVALNQIDLEIPEGSIFGLLGPNGAGKTSLIRIINQITEADTGKVYFKGDELNSQHIGQIGYLPEERGLYKKVKVIHQLEYFGRLRGLSSSEARKRAGYWLDRLQLSHVRMQKIEELSKGMQQKIQFIVAIIHQPEFLILDEPFSGFDPVNAELITEIIKDLRKGGCTILFSTHRMESVEKLCDHLAMIHRSEKILDGKVSEIKNRYKSDSYIISTGDALAKDDPNYQILEESVNDAGFPSYKINSRTLSSKELIRLLNERTELISFTQYFPSIHEIFIQLAQPESTI